MQLPKYSIGLGDRFAQQAAAQLRACEMAAQAGVQVTPVWNKSNREHLIVGSDPSQTRAAVDSAVQRAGWRLPYFVDADHIRLATFARYVEPCDFFTIDVADRIGQEPGRGEVEVFLLRHPELIGNSSIPGVMQAMHLHRGFVEQTAWQYLAAVREAGRVYRAIAEAKGTDNFVVEISMDETDKAQTPAELLVILAAVADEKIPLQTLAPKFSGRFLKGVDYAGDVAQFEREFRDDIATLAHAAQRYSLPPNLKLSVHSGSDKYSIYPAIRRALQDSGAGVHVKTAGTTWLEELTALAEAGGEALYLLKKIYAQAYARMDELCAPYAAVLQIDTPQLPLPSDVSTWSSDQFVSALRHAAPDEPRRPCLSSSPAYNPHLRQLLHVAFKIAAEHGTHYLDALQANRDLVADRVTFHLFERHIRPAFIEETPR